VLLVGDLLRSVEDQFRIAFPRRIWVLGVVRGLQGRDPVEFLLTETHEDGRRRTLPSELGGQAWDGIDATLRRLHDVAVDDLLVDGHLVRVGGLLSYDSERHVVVFSVTALDPEPTRAWLSDRRESLREAALRARLGERQRDARVALAPTSIGLVGSTGDAGLVRARAALAAEDFSTEIVEYPVTAVGADISDALATAVRQACAGQHDVVLLVREEGRPLALAPFDAEQVVRAVADAPVPVITGLGSGEQPTAVDEVAHQMCATPAEAGDAVVRRLQRASDLVEQAVRTLHDTGDDALRRAARHLEQTRAEVAEHARRARVRAEQAKARRVLAIRVAAAVVAVLVVVLAVLVAPWLAALLVLPLAVAVFAERLRPRRRSSPMALDTLSFSAALKRLGTIQHELDEASDPDDVERLESQAAEIADHCRALLRRGRPLRDGRPAVVATGPVRAGHDDEPTDSYRTEPRTDADATGDRGGAAEPVPTAAGGTGPNDLEQTQAIPVIRAAGPPPPAQPGPGSDEQLPDDAGATGPITIPEAVAVPEATVDLRVHDTTRVHDGTRLHDGTRVHDTGRRHDGGPSGRGAVRRTRGAAGRPATAGSSTADEVEASGTEATSLRQRG